MKKWKHAHTKLKLEIFFSIDNKIHQTTHHHKIQTEKPH